MASSTQSISNNEVARLQNKILRELRRIHGSERIPQDLTIDLDQERCEVVRKLTLLNLKLKDIESTVEHRSQYERQSSLDRALVNMSISRSISQRALQTAIGKGHSAIPLCIPDNYQWEPSEGRLVPLEGVQRSGLKPCNEGLELLRSIKGPISVVCVVGPARSGKSYLLSQLQGSQFRLGHTMKAETMGIWIGSKAVEHRLRSGEKVTVVFLDSEGIGSTDSKDTTDSTDNQIFTLSVLVSSLLIYNSMKVPNNTDLEKLHFVSKLSDSIRVRQNTENTADDVARFRECSPEFFWLIRDVTLAITDVNDQPCDINTYMNQKILKEENGVRESTKRKNEIRKTIKSFFQSVNAFTLPVPSENVEVLKEMSNPGFKSLLNKKFVEKLESLKSSITERYHPKKGLNDSMVTGCQLADMLENYVRALNTKGYVPDWQSAWDMTVRMAYQRAGENAFKIYKALMSPMIPTFPCDEAEIMAEHENSLKDAIQLFREETLMDPDVEQFKENLQEFTKKCALYEDDGKCIDGLLFTYLQKNRELSDMFCNDILQELHGQELEPVLQNIDHETSYEYILFVIGEVEAKYLDCALGPCAGDVFQRYLSNLEERKKQIMKTVSLLEDYNNEIEREKLEKAHVEAACEEIERENERLQRQREAHAKQHLDQIEAIREANESKIRQLKEENDKAMRSQSDALERQRVTDMDNLRKEHARMEAQRNQQMQELRREQTDMNQQLQAARQEVQRLQNRPPTVVHRKKKGCSIM